MPVGRSSLVLALLVLVAWVCACAQSAPPPPAATTGAVPLTSSVGQPQPWQPVNKVREVNVFNLLDQHTLFGLALRAACTGPLQEALFAPYGCPNLGVIEMDSIDIGDESQEANLVATVVATTGLPAAVMAYFEVASNFNLTSTSCAANNATCQSITNRLLKRDFNEVVSMAASAFATTVAFQSIIEFEDNDRDGVFDSKTDKLVSSYDFLSPSADANPLWGPMNLVERMQPSGLSEFALNVTTRDGVFSVEFTVTDSFDDPSMARTKISVQIKDFPFVSSTSRLALSTFLGAAKAHASVASGGGVVSADIVPGSSQVVLNSGGLAGFYGWITNAIAAGIGSPTTYGTVRVLASPWQELGSTGLEDVQKSIASVALLGNEGGSSTAAVKQAYFSFEAQTPSYVYWDPELVFGGVTDPTQSSTGLAVIAVTVAGCLAVLVFGVSMAVLYSRRAYKQVEFPPLMKQMHNRAAGEDGEEGGIDDRGSQDTYISPLTTEGSVYVSAEVAAAGAVLRSPAALVTCHVCHYTGQFGEGFCGNCGMFLNP